MPNPTAAMLVIGDEILSGRTLDSNTNHLAKELTAHGIDLCEVRVVSDDARAIVAAVRALSDSFEHVFTSGGIGPTHDDITADCIAEAFGQPIDIRDDARALLAAHYERQGSELNEARLRMARIPEGATLIDNPVSVAPGFILGNVHVMAGKTAVDSASTACFVENLKYAADKADAAGCGLLIEPLNTRDAAGYFLTSLEQAADILDKVGHPSVKIMFDCYHIQIMQGDLVMRARAFADMIGHIQFAGVPDRGEPDKSEIDYSFVLPQLCEDGYDSFLGAEYRPRTTTDAGLGWMERFRR